MCTGRRLWIGFGTLTALLVLLGLTVIARIQSIESGVGALTSAVYLRSVAATELEQEALAYQRAVHAYLLRGDPAGRRVARAHGAAVRQRMADYGRGTPTGRQRELSARFAASWAELEALGESLLNVENSPPPPESLASFGHVGGELQALLDGEMLPDAADALRAANESTVRDLSVSRSAVLLMVIASVAIAVMTAKRVSDGILRTEKALADVHRQLEETFALLDRMLSNSPVGLAFLDRELRYLRVNESLAAINGLPVRDHLGKTVAEVLPRLWPVLEPQFRQVVEEGRPVVELECSTGGPDPEGSTGGPLEPGDSRHWLVTYYPIFGNGGGMIGVGVVVVDVTAQKRAAEVLREADRRKDEFLATLAHELRNPLAPLQNALHILRMGRGGTSLNTTLDLMDRQLAQVIRLVDDLLDVGRIAGGKLELRKEPIALSAVVDRAVECSRPLIDARGHALTVSLPREPVHMLADPARLAQVFSNLLNNSAKYTEKGGEIRLAAERRGSEVVVQVRDNGTGIPADVLPRVFDMFTQADRPLERGAGGLGIGLTLARRLVEMHAGAIRARSEGPGRGSEMTVTLPVLEDESASPAPPRERASPGPAPGHRILVVDDVADIVESLAMILEMMGHEVRTAGDGLAALRVGEELHPEIVLLDLGMPNLNGFDTCRRIRQRPWGKTAVVVAQTGWGSDEDRLRTRESGFDLHVVKPVEPEALMKRIEAAFSVRGPRG